VARKESKLGKSEIKTLQRPLRITFWSILFSAELWITRKESKLGKSEIKTLQRPLRITFWSILFSVELRITFWSILFSAEFSGASDEPSSPSAFFIFVFHEAVADHLLEHTLLGRVTESKLGKSESKLGKS
jgi:hypothetical protein